MFAAPSGADVIVLASGWSVSQYNLRGLEDRGMLIAVNDSAIYTKPLVAFTMDRLWIEGRLPLLRVQRPPYVLVRKGVLKNSEPPSWLTEFAHDGMVTEMSSLKGQLNGANSGACALNLAFQLSPRRVFLLGFDMQRGPKQEPYWYPPYPWAPAGATKKGKYVDWVKDFYVMARQFEDAGIEVFNVNNHSMITAFKTISFDQFTLLT